MDSSSLKKKISAPQLFGATSSLGNSMSVGGFARSMSTDARCFGSAFSPLDPNVQAFGSASLVTPKRKLSLDLDTPSTQPDQEPEGTRAILCNDSACFSSLGSPPNPSSPLTEDPNCLNCPLRGRKTLLARRLLPHRSYSNPFSSENKENVESGGFFYRKQSLPSIRPLSLPCFPPGSPTQTYNPLKQINSPLERLHLFSPSRSCSSAATADSDGYFSEVFSDACSPQPPTCDSPSSFPKQFTSLLNGPLSSATSEPCVFKKPKSPPTTTFVDNPPVVGDSQQHNVVCPTPVRPSTTKVKSFGCRRASLKRTSPSSSCSDAPPQKHIRKKPPLPFGTDSSSPSDKKPFPKGTPFQRSHSMCVSKSPYSPSGVGNDFIGDQSKPHALPVMSKTEKNPDLHNLTPETVAKLVSGEFSSTVENYKIIDCRYPYEYDGGHIQGAVNIWSKDTLMKEYFNNPTHPDKDRRSILIFHCEFSSKRGPDMCRFIREKDRKSNGMENFPKLYYPELYLLSGGYKAFHSSYPDICVPMGAYRTMLDEDHVEDLKHFQKRSKSWNGERQSRIKQNTICRRSSISELHGSKS